MTITGGNVTGNGGGINVIGDLSMRDVRVTGNAATSAGGGIFFTTSSHVDITESTIDGNQAVYGGGIFGHLAFTDSLQIDRSTISGNTASGIGGGIQLQELASISTTGGGSITNSTISGNTGGTTGGIRVAYGATMDIRNTTITGNKGDWGGGLTTTWQSSTVHTLVTLHNTILADNRNAADTANSDYAGHNNLQSASSYNLMGLGGSGGLSNGVNGNIVLTTGQTAGLAPLGDYGGKTRTHALKTGSLAIDKGLNSLVSGGVDQRGAERPVDLAGVTNASGSAYADIGAFEAGDETILTVRHGSDRNNSSFTTVNPDSLSLREALWLASQLAGEETVEFDEALHASSPHQLAISLGQLTVSDGTNIAGPGADKVIIDANSTTNLLYVPGASEISGITLTEGAGYYGSGIRVGTSADLTLRGVRVVDNEAAYYGGGIASEGALRIYDSEISDNTVTSGNGGGIHSAATSSTDVLEIVNTTISGNSASNYGGGAYISVGASHGLHRIVNSTITDNNAYWYSGGGLHLVRSSGSADFLLLYNTIVADNLSAGEIVGDYVDAASAYNLLRSGQSGGLSGGTGNIFLTGVQTAKLEALGFHGGRTRAHRLLNDSSALDAGDNSWAATLDLEFDQRGQERIVDNWDSDAVDEIDIGAVEMAFDEFV
jgi:hypothetical protein